MSHGSWVRLPLTGLEVELRTPDGFDDLVLAEAGRAGLDLALEVADRLAPPLQPLPAGGWVAVPLTDFDILFLQLRRFVFGDRVRAESVCPSEACGRRIDAEFRVSEYLEHHRPEPPDGRIQPGAEPGWYRMLGVEFRAPAVGDLLGTAGGRSLTEALTARCLRPSGVRGSARRQVETALARLAPNLCTDLQAVCPECESRIGLRFDPQGYVLAELRADAAGIHQDVHLLASTYQWTEAAILALPGRRRRAYVQLIEDERGVR